MIASELSSLLRGKRIGQGKYQAKCPAHDDRNPSLSIRDGKKGVLIQCWGGCEKEAVLEACGLKFSDLFYDNGLTNRKDIEAARILREQTEAVNQAKRRELTKQVQTVRNWETAAEVSIPAMLEEGRIGDNAAKSFHYALEQARKCNEILTNEKSFAEVECYGHRETTKYF
jgi:hypothetical protein